MASKQGKGNGRKKKKSSPAKRTFTMFVMLLVSGTLFYNVFTEIMETHSLNVQLNEAGLSQEELTQRKEELSTQKDNLNDTEYLIRYARAKYLATKEDGEQVFKLPEEESDSEE